MNEETGWVRLYYRNGKSKAFRVGADLDRALARKVPAIVYQAKALIHRCQSCKASGPWTATWRAYPVLRHHPAEVQARAGGAAEYIVCSAACWDTHLNGMEPPHWADLNREPLPVEDRRALYSAQLDDRTRAQEAKAYRKVPMPAWLGEGHCKWCNGKMTPADKPSWLWHKGCAEQYLLHSNLLTQIRFLRKRDGRECAEPGCERSGEEVDHDRPLWSVRHLPDDERREFYGPKNLRLRCGPCHAAKTKREAAERAREKAATRDQPRLV